MMWRYTVTAMKFALVTTLIFGVVYPLAVTGIAQVVFPKQANGSLVTAGGRVVGSELIGQGFAGRKYFHPRPSAAGAGYDATASGGSNLGPTSKTLVNRIATDAKETLKENPGLAKGKIPADMLTTSASGLDPDISPANAYAQAARVAKARGMTVDEIRRLVDKHTVDRQFGLLGEPRVNVLKLNLALDNRQR